MQLGSGPGWLWAGVFDASEHFFFLLGMKGQGLLAFVSCCLDPPGKGTGTRSHVSRWGDA